MNRRKKRVTFVLIIVLIILAICLAVAVMALVEQGRSNSNRADIERVATESVATESMVTESEGRADDIVEQEDIQETEGNQPDIQNSDGLISEANSEAEIYPIEVISEENTSEEQPEETEEPTSNNQVQDNLIGVLSGAVIGIDAGHQGRGNSELERSAPGSSAMKAKVTSGTSGVASKVPEHVVNLDVALLLKAKLEAMGAEVLMVRETADVDISNVQRAVMMNERGVDLCIRIHANGSESSSTRGAMMLIPRGMTISGLEDASRAAGTIIFESFLSATGARDAGIIPRGDLTGFNWSEVPVCLIELGFMSNPEEDLMLTSPEYQEKCADGLAKGIEAWWNSIL